MSDLRRIKREITEEQYINATVNHDAKTIFTDSEVMGYGVYCTEYFKENDKYYVSFSLGSSCD